MDINYDTASFLACLLNQDGIAWRDSTAYYYSITQFTGSHCGHEFWVMTRRIKASQTQAPLTKGQVRSPVIREGPRVDQLLHADVSQVERFSIWPWCHRGASDVRCFWLSEWEETLETLLNICFYDPDPNKGLKNLIMNGKIIQRTFLKTTIKSVRINP